MSDTNISPNMSLPIPVTNVDAGPDYANNVNASLLTIDAHNHSAGSGVQVTPNGININADLPFAENNATGLRTIRFEPQSAVLSLPADIGCIYEVDDDLYYNDGLGNQVRITQSGGVAGSPGSIGSLTPPASVTYVSATPAYVFESDTNTAAILDAGSIIIRKLTASSNGITIEAPPSIAADYSIVLPAALPGATEFMTITSAGQIAATIPVANGITRTMQAAVGQQVSSTCGSFFTTSGTFVDVTSLTVTITTLGRPVMWMVQSDASGTSSQITGIALGINILRDATTIATYEYGSPDEVLLASLSGLDVVGAGTYTYKMQIKSGGGATVGVFSMKLLAYEL